jgi:hypothetical protein
MSAVDPSSSAITSAAPSRDDWQPGKEKRDPGMT